MAQRKIRRPATTLASKNVNKSSYRIRNGQEVRPAKYYGKHVGHGNYMAGVINGELVVDSVGKPLPYKQI